jgi:ABC-type cobalamin/Fe3+-siderophores transport system ATPase subunit
MTDAVPNPFILSADNIHAAYGDRPVLTGVSLSIAAGELVVILGPNGSGKSTLVRTLLGAVPATGTIDWFGIPLAKWKRRRLARRVAYLPQSPGFEPGQTVGDILRLGRAPYWSAFGVESAEDVGVVRRVASETDLSDWLDRPIDTLSGGQRQQVFVGRCLVQEPAVILLDEPTAHLDLRHQIDLCQRLRTLTREKQIGVLVVLHDLNLAAHVADRIVLLSNGAVAADGKPGDVLTPDMIAAVYGLPVRSVLSGNNRPVLVPAVYGSDPADGRINRSSTSNSRS